MWCAGAIGTLAGLGSWYQALIGTGSILVANGLLRPLDVFSNRLGLSQRALVVQASAGSAPMAATFRVRAALPAGTRRADGLARTLALLLAHQPLNVSLEPAAGAAASLWVTVSPSQLADLLAALQSLADVVQVHSALIVAPIPPDLGARND